jgi:hypothetical protein
MKFQYVNQPPNPYDYHVARADLPADWDILRMVAYGTSTSEAEDALLAAIPNDAHIIDLEAC